MAQGDLERWTNTCSLRTSITSWNLDALDMAAEGELPSWVIGLPPRQSPVLFNYADGFANIKTEASDGGNDSPADSAGIFSTLGESGMRYNRGEMLMIRRGDHGRVGRIRVPGVS